MIHSPDIVPTKESPNSAPVTKSLVESLREVIQSNLEVADTPPDFALLFAKMCVESGRNFTVKDVLAAVPRHRGQPIGEMLLSAMANLGFEASQLDRKCSFSDISGPLLHVDPDGQVSLYTLRGGDIWSAPCDGQAMPVDVALGDLPGRVWLFRSERMTNSVSEDQRRHTGHKWFRALLSHLNGATIALLTITAALSVAALVVPLLVAVFYSQIVSLSSLSLIPSFAMAAVLLMGFEFMLLNLRARTMAWLANRLDYLVSTTSFDKLMRIAPMIAERASPNDQAARLRSFENIRDFLAGPVAVALFDLPLAFLVLPLVAIVFPSIAGIILLSFITYSAMFVLSWRKIRVHTSVLAEESTEVQRATIETFEKRDLIRECGLQELWADRHTSALLREQKAQVRLLGNSAVAEAFASYFFAATVTLLLARMATLVWAGEMVAGEVLALLLVCLRLLAPFHALCLSIPRVEQARKSLGQINQLMEMPSEEESYDMKRKLGDLRGRITFLNTAFRVGDTRPVFVGLDIDIAPGEVIGIAGANGSGKSTILKLANGMANAPMGAIRLDGIDQRQLSLHEIRRRISYVPQNPNLLPGSLRANLLYANPLATNKQLGMVIKLVGLHRTIGNMPGGLDAIIDPAFQRNFGADFRFRFAFAQALLVNGKLLLIDEIPNALLDGDVGSMLRKLLTASHGKRTVMFVSHRSDFLSIADRVITLRYGKVPQILTSQALLDKMS